jgi:lipoprotein-anchoring transpeptidase ErfK/SrfK
MCRTLTGVVAGSLAILASASGLAAQSWVWRDDGTVERRGPSRYDVRPSGPGWWQDQPSWDRRSMRSDQRWGSWDQDPRFTPGGEEVRDGGPRPAIAPLAPPRVAFPYPYAANSIVIDVSARRLYFVLPDRQAYAYQISVGREGFGWTGTEKVSRVQAWPDWHPPAEMRARDPSLPVKMTGGIRNPLGATALYLGTTLYRIHGTNDEKSLGQASSSGCFRMLNANVLHLASLADVGTLVTVVASLGPGPVAEEPLPPTRASAPAELPPQRAPSSRSRRDVDEWERVFGQRRLRDDPGWR